MSVNECEFCQWKDAPLAVGRPMSPMTENKDFMQGMVALIVVRAFFFFSSRSRHTIFDCDWSSDVCSSDLPTALPPTALPPTAPPSTDLDHIRRTKQIEEIANNLIGTAPAAPAYDDEGLPIF